MGLILNGSSIEEHKEIVEKLKSHKEYIDEMAQRKEI
jgi:hypothetical protein